MKYIANIISFSRIVMATSLFWFINNKVLYIIIYSLCWFSDAIDGTIARATHSQSELGSRIDDIADTTLIVIAGIIMIIWIKAAILKFIPLTIALIIIRLVNLMITKHKYGKSYILHTYAAKFLGLLVLFMPIVYLLFGFTNIVSIVLIFAIIVSIEESLIHLNTEVFNSDRKSLFIKKA